MEKLRLNVRVLLAIISIPGVVLMLISVVNIVDATAPLTEIGMFNLLYGLLGIGMLYLSIFGKMPSFRGEKNS